MFIIKEMKVRFKIICGLFLFIFMENSLAFSLDIGISGVRIKKNLTNFKEIKTQNVVTQTLDYSCGPASLATLLSYYFQDKVTEEEIIKFLLLTTDLKKVKQKKGFSLLDLKNFAKYKGYQVVGYKMDLEYLSHKYKGLCAFCYLSRFKGRPRVFG